jgi:hypothetical protein
MVTMTTHLSPQFKNHAQTAANVGLAVGLAASVGVAGMTSRGAEGDYINGLSASQNDKILQRPTNSPSWDNHLSRQFEGFRDIDKKPETAIPSRLAVVHPDSSASSMSLDRAARINSDQHRANNVWVVGAKW